MSTVGERVAWRSRVENADQRLLLTALGMLADDQLKVSFSLEALSQITMQDEMTICITLRQLLLIGAIRPAMDDRLFSYRLTLSCMGFVAKGKKLSPEESSRFLKALGGSSVASRLFSITATSICLWRHNGMPVKYLRF